MRQSADMYIGQPFYKTLYLKNCDQTGVKSIDVNEPSWVFEAAILDLISNVFVF